MQTFNIAICITTFLRDTLLFNTINSIETNLPENCIVLVADQGYASDEKTIQMDYYKSQMPLEYYRLPFDCGLSAGRNFLVNKAKELGIPYCLIGADSIQFIDKYNFTPYINIINSGTCDVIGFDLENSKCPWEFYLQIKNNTLYYNYSTDYITQENIKLLKIDICRNIFLAKTDAILNLWDKEMKLCEHTLAFWTLKTQNKKVCWTDTIKFKRVQLGSSDEYKTYRKRTRDFQKLLKIKLNIGGWKTP